MERIGESNLIFEVVKEILQNFDRLFLAAFNRPLSSHCEVLLQFQSVAVFNGTEACHPPMPQYLAPQHHEHPLSFGFSNSAVLTEYLIDLFHHL